MKAIVWTQYGPPEVLQLRDVPKPVPAENEICIRVKASTVTTGDCEMRAFRFPAWFWLPLRFAIGLFRPRKLSLGQDVSGIIDSVGARVTRFKAGDEVFASTALHLSAYAEYVCLPENFSIVIKPPSLPFDVAATIVTGGVNGQHFVRKIKLQRGERLLLIGAGGSIGTYALQIAVAQGAEVTCVDASHKHDMLLHLGASRVIDYQKEDFAAQPYSYHAVIDIVGTYSIRKCLNVLLPGGRLMLGNPRVMHMLAATLAPLFTDKKIYFEFAGYDEAQMLALARRIEAGEIKVFIDRRFPLGKTVEAHHYVDRQLKRGNVIITVSDPVERN